MQREDVGLVASKAAQLSIAVRDIAVRSTVKTVATHAMLFVQPIGDRVDVGVFGKSVMKGRVEDGDLRERRSEIFAGSTDACKTCRIVERSKLDALFDIGDYFVIDQDRFGEQFCTVDDAMADGVNLDRNRSKNLLERGFVGGAFTGTVGEALIAIMLNAIEIGGDDLVFEGGAARIENQNVHGNY